MRKNLITYALRAVPVFLYTSKSKSYPWPRKNKCRFCSKGKFRHEEGSAILVCKVCNSDFHIPHQA